MSESKKTVQFSEYENSVHVYGRIWMALALMLMLAVPVAICVYYDAWPEGQYLLKGLLGVAPMFWTVGIIEVLTYTPMLGTGGTYLAFVTGNLTNLKVPCALNAMEAAKIKPGTEEGEAISTIAVASSSIVTTLVIALGVVGLNFLRPALESPELKPAFDNILPALFGALGAVFVSKNPKLAAAPLAFMVALFLLVPGLSSSVGILVPVGALIAIGVARILYKKGMLDDPKKKASSAG
ncbi:MAG: hypothetical protein VB099_06245 [Candidatus Limiplasma sp.]|nr:hypothetical protein [Candidatus Limiplasma sp.]